MFWASHTKTTATGPFLRSQDRSEFARIAVREVVIGTAGAIARFMTCRFRAKW